MKSNLFNNINSDLTMQLINEDLQGTLYGPNNIFSGTFTMLGSANSGDIVIRHIIDEKGMKIAKEKNIAGLITQNPQKGVIEFAKKNNVSLIVLDKIEFANAFALQWTIQKFAKDSIKVIITGTNGKSTTSHMIFNILSKNGYNTYTNTDSKSEFNTLIDPMVPKQITDYALKLEKSNETIDALVIEVSEIQGWEDRVMHDHAYLMTKSIGPNASVITNVTMDHIGLVNVIDDVYYEVSGAVRATDSGFVILNSEDELVMKMVDFVNDDVKTIFHGNNSSLRFVDNSDKKKGIYLENKLFLSVEDLPFKSKHFIENTLASIATCLALDIPKNIIIGGIRSYFPLKRRFSILNQEPLVIDDFAHNPDGIKATIESASKLKGGKLYIACAIRGSRGIELNKLNAQAIVEVLNNIESDYELLLTSSIEEVNHLNTVLDSEKEVFLDILCKNNINFSFYEKLINCLSRVISLASKEDVILLIGAQGMDPAAELIKNKNLL